MSNIDRYHMDFGWGYFTGEDHQNMIGANASHDGEWVRFSEHQTQINVLQIENETMKNKMLRMAKALFDILDGTPDHDINVALTGLYENHHIIEARAEAERLILGESSHA